MTIPSSSESGPTSPRPQPVQNGARTPPRVLSKSKLIAFRQCPKRLWLEVYRPELREDSAATQASFQVGYQVGDIARRIYDGEAKGVVIDVKTEGFSNAFARSATLLAESRRPVFEAGLKAAGALAFADVMLPDNQADQDAWKMVEVKSSTGVKDYHRDDVALQAFVAREAGVKLSSVAVACIDSSWVYPGAEDYAGLLKENDLTAESMARTEEVRTWIAAAHQVLAQETEPLIAVGAQCHDPFECSFCIYCTAAISQPEFPANWLPRLSPALRGQLDMQGITDMREVPDELLDQAQALVKRHTLDRSAYFDAAGAADDLAPYGFPAYFLDFESIQFPVPIWKGTRPYQQNVFQFSVHLLGSDGELSQKEFLNLSGNDPSEDLANALIAACGERGPIFVYNATFETTRISELAERYPTMAGPLLSINSRVVDLHPIARRRYYHHSQRGSWSIKVVLPAAVPSLGYDQLAGVKDGSMAMEAYLEAIERGTSPERRTEIERQLLAYCRLDTFAMVRLWQFFSGRTEMALRDVPWKNVQVDPPTPAGVAG